MRATLHETADTFIVIMKQCFQSEDITFSSPACDMCAGELQKVIQWITGHVYPVKEIECRAMGCPADVFCVSKAREGR